MTVDTEFLRETTFWPKVCVIQLASPEEAAAIDALADGIDLTPFFELMANEAVVKVFHAARQDLEIVWRLAELIPKPLFDTQVAAMVCGFGDQASYGAAKAIARVSVDKSSRFTDWSRRPLSEAQVRYAIADVTHLRDIYLHLRSRLERTARLDWLADEMESLTSPATYEQHPDDAWERLRHRARKPRDLAALIEPPPGARPRLSRATFRARACSRTTRSSRSRSPRRARRRRSNLRAIPRGLERSRSGAEILAAIERAMARDPATLPAIERTAAAPTARRLSSKVLLRQVCEETGVAAKMIATVDDLEAIAANDNADVAALRGWRRTVFGEKALELKRGRLALAVENGRVVTLDWQDA